MDSLIISNLREIMIHQYNHYIHLEQKKLCTCNLCLQNYVFFLQRNKPIQLQYYSKTLFSRYISLHDHLKISKYQKQFSASLKAIDFCFIASESATLYNLHMQFSYYCSQRKHKEEKKTIYNQYKILINTKGNIFDLQKITLFTFVVIAYSELLIIMLKISH